ncbi:hypothetical protein CFP56_033810 [Quercus suber]|uniref:Uncharacterized protein n=1 Tax=Quercus suber TaxID=58331 RepID=A0AAW0LUA1_QUESU
MGKPSSIQAQINRTHLAIWCLRTNTSRFPLSYQKMLHCTTLERTHIHMGSNCIQIIHTLCIPLIYRLSILMLIYMDPTRCTWIFGMSVESLMHTRFCC